MPNEQSQDHPWYSDIWNWIADAFLAVAAWIGPLDFATTITILLVGLIAVSIVVMLRQVKIQQKSMNQTEDDDAKVSIPRVTWEEIAGCEEAKEALQETVSFLRQPEKFAHLGARVPKGVLLHGPPGTGKTLLAKAVASQSGAHFFAATGSSFVDTYVGVGAKRVRTLFKQARAKAPAVVFLDEIDAIGQKRGMRPGSGSDEYDRTLNQILSELDGVADSPDPVILIAATNRISDLDPALLRPGRIDRKMTVPPPDIDGREKILKIHTKNKPIWQVDLRIVAKRTIGMSGAELANICNEAAIIAGREDRRYISQEDLLKATRQEMVGTESRRPLTEREKRIVAYHEAGHAVCQLVQKEIKDPVESVTIVPHSGGSLGHTLTPPSEDTHLDHREEIEAELVVLMGGRAGELYINEETNGASGDFQHVHSLARSYVGQWGWGDNSPILWPTNTADISDLTRRSLDISAAGLAKKSLNKARRLLYRHSAFLEAVANALLEKETLERDELEMIAWSYSIPPKPDPKLQDVLL